MEHRPFGKTGEEFSILSFGAQRIVDSHGCSEPEAIRMVNHAIDSGIRRFDTARIYAAGQSEERVGKVAAHRRSEMWIATKAWARDRDGARQQLEKNLAVAEAHQPLSDAERLSLFQEILPRVTPANAPWKAASWQDPVPWAAR